MRSNVKHLLVAATAALALVGCGHDTGSPGGDEPSNNGGGGSGGNVTLQQMPDAFANAYCKKLVSCCDKTERSAMSTGFLELNLETEQGCKDAYGGLLRLFKSSLDTSIQEGRAGYDAAAMGNCVASIEALSCSELPEGAETDFTGQCDSPFVPKVEVGGSCKEDYECKEGECKTEGTSDMGTCTKIPGKGEECDTECQEDLVCRNSTCEKRERKEVGKSCFSSADCKSSRCEDDGSGNRVCQPKLESGETCSRNDECKSGLCDKEESSDDGSCLPAPACDGSN